MSVALNDVALVRDLFKDIADFTHYEDVKRAVHTLYKSRKQHHAFVVNILAQALYELFSAKDGNEIVSAYVFYSCSHFGNSQSLCNAFRTQF